MNEFVFKGSRDYLHSTTVFDWILARLDYRPTNVDFVFNRKTAMKCKLVEAVPEVEGVLVGKWKDARHAFTIVETQEPITERRDYDEDRIGAACQFDGATVTLPETIGHSSLIERLVAGYKALLLRQPGLQASKLAFVRLKLDVMPDSQVSIHFVRRMGPNFFHGNVTQDSRKLGEIYFGRWR